jgi:hypothetical protein
VTFSATNRAESPCETSTPSCAAFSTPAYNYGVASGCNTSTPGCGNIDLTGTPFHVSVSEVGMANGGSTGMTTYSSNRKMVDTVSGGSCGHQFPSNGSNRLTIELD